MKHNLPHSSEQARLWEISSVPDYSYRLLDERDPSVCGGCHGAEQWENVVQLQTYLPGSKVCGVHIGHWRCQGWLREKLASSYIMLEWMDAQITGNTNTGPGADDRNVLVLYNHNTPDIYNLEADCGFPNWDSNLMFVVGTRCYLDVVCNVLNRI